MSRAIWPIASRVPIFALIYALSMNAAQSQTKGDYADWIRPYQKGPLPAWFFDEPSEAKLVITEIVGDDSKQEGPKDEFSRLNRSRPFRSIYAVSKDGQRSGRFSGPMGTGGGNHPRMSEADQKRLDELLANLPDDFSSLPPPNRRLVFQVAAAGGVIARVYDRANAPDKILEMLRLTDCNIKSWVLTFQPKDQWPVGGSDHDGFLTLSRDGLEVVSSGLHGSFRFWNPDTHDKLREIPTSSIETCGGNSTGFPITGLSFSPDGSLAVAEGWGDIYLLDGESFKCLRRFSGPFVGGKGVGYFNPLFTPDGRYLLIQTSSPELLIFDTKTWRQVSTLPEVPAGALAFFPAPGGRPSVYLSQAGEIALWNPRERRNIAVLDNEGKIEKLAYSPDGSMVAAVTVHHATEKSPRFYRMRIWNAENGTLVQELRLFEQEVDPVEGLLWWPDGNYILAATQVGLSSERDVGIWNARTGRHRGELVGCGGQASGLALLADGRLLEGCDDGIVRVWQAPEIIKQVSAFESSLAATEQ